MSKQLERVGYTKFSAQGNRFIVINAKDLPASIHDSDLSPLAKELASLGFDQLLVVHPTDDPNRFRVTVVNVDGTYAEQCGNGMRALAHHWALTHSSFDMCDIEFCPPAGPVNVTGFRPMDWPQQCWVEVTLPGPRWMGHHTAASELITGPGILISMGNPHLILPWPHPPSSEECESVGHHYQHHPEFDAGINVSLTHALGDRVIARVYERGAGPTPACGSGACAIAAAHRQHHPHLTTLTVEQPGGAVVVHWPLDSTDQVALSGDVIFHEQGQLSIHGL